jgi:hypothetical protein
MALRATEGNEKPAGGEDAANEWRVEAGFSTERTGIELILSPAPTPSMCLRHQSVARLWRG